MAAIVPIAATATDPVHRPGAQTLCQVCIKKPAATPPKRADGRGAAAKARWAAMSPEAKKAHVEKMQAGRGVIPKSHKEVIAIE